MLVIMHFALFISHYAGFGTHSKLSNFWVASDSPWVEPLICKHSMFTMQADHHGTSIRSHFHVCLKPLCSGTYLEVNLFCILKEQYDMT